MSSQHHSTKKKEMYHLECLLKAARKVTEMMKLEEYLLMKMMKE
jgi:hypothetical protein